MQYAANWHDLKYFKIVKLIFLAFDTFNRHISYYFVFLQLQIIRLNSVHQ